MVRRHTGPAWAVRAKKTLLPGATLLATLLVPLAAHAQDKTFYLDRLQIGGAPADGLGIWRPEIGQTRLYGQFGLGFSLNPLRVDNHVDNLDKAETLKGPPVANQLTAYITAGAEILERGAVQVTLPLALYQSGNPTGNSAVALNQNVNMQAFAPMDMRLDGRFIVFRTEDKSFKLGLRASAFLPTGDEFSFGGDKEAWGSVGLATEYDAKKFFITVNAGFSIRPTAKLHELTVGRELTYGVGGYVPLMQDRLRIGAEIFGSVGMLPETLGELDASPLEWSLSGRMALDAKKISWAGLSIGSRLTGGYAPDMRIVAVVGGAFQLKDTEVGAGSARYQFRDDVDTDKDGFPDLVDMCPVDKEDKAPPNPDDGCPTMSDLDKDGIPDNVDKCPAVPEDKDNIDDRDGCPEDDADQDTVPDVEDKCPKEPGMRGDDPEKEGCPQFIRRISGSSEIQITKQVEFEFDSNVILPKSYPILDEVVRLLRANPEIKLVSVEGHTDDVGKPEYNDKLSANRAAAVRDYLINKGGIAANRLQSKGFGARKPVASNASAEGQARNRRVEFHIVTQAIEGR
ncbi:OmpA family protein [Polyangium jinanense]|uniref:OmpA family protein n=1 Tax=Polyangium jinanense TaxID=2829994 RepID=A0A9X3X8F6_9BACT|nr:OmpA family protein [Polyangium jinanense]MDC3985664.1 OmpA family protein [Polyangium jinanense]